MNPVAIKKAYAITPLLALIIVLLITGNSVPAQTNLQELTNRVDELEKKLADAKVRQEKAYTIQMRLQEQENKLASLAELDKYKLQIIQIRADIKNIHTRIAAITKETNDLEENLRFAKNLQAILAEAKMTTNLKFQNNKINQSQAQEKNSTKISLIEKEFPAKPTINSLEKNGSWYVENIKIGSHFNENERKEITNNFISGQQVDQDTLLNNAYQFYKLNGVTLRFLIHPKSGNTMELEIILDQREDNANSYFTFFTPMTLNHFRSERFKVTVAK